MAGNAGRRGEATVRSVASIDDFATTSATPDGAGTGAKRRAHGCSGQRASDRRGRADDLRADRVRVDVAQARSEEHTSELQSRGHLVCRLLLEKKNSAIIK